LAGSPQILPGGKALLYTISTGGGAEAWDKGQIFVQSLKPGGARKPIIQGGADGRYVSTGHIVYAFGGTLFAVPFDLGRLQVTGGQVPVVEGVRRSGATGSAQFSFSDTGSLIYIPGPVSATTGSGGVLATISLQSGQASAPGIERLKAPPKAYAFPRVSPDGKQVAVSTDDAKDTNVWIVDLAGATAPRQLTLGGANRFPVWSAGGDRVAFQSDREGDPGIFWQKADGTGTAERLTKPEKGIAHIPDSWSPDGKWLAYTAVKGNEFALWMLSLQDKKTTVFAEKAGARIGRAAFSPHGDWLAYQSTETGTNQIFVQPFPATGAKYPVVVGGHPFWSPDGQAIILNPGAGLIGTVLITTRPTFSFGPLLQLPGGTSGLFSRNPASDPRVWDITRDGKRILGVTNPSTGDASSSSGTPAAPSIQVVLNWFEDLKQRMTVH
jgi:Tol biopolymer transport system component